MKYVVLFEDNPDADPDVRARHMAGHLAFLERNAAVVEAAGPLKQGDGAAAGGLWIVDARDQAEIARLVEEDPFWPTGLRRSVRILAWSRVFAGGRRLISP